MIRLLVTGGTFDKEYDEVRGRLFFKDTHVQEMLDKGRSRVPVSIRTLMMIDSLDMTDADRAAIVQAVRAAGGSPELVTQSTGIVILHGTDTLSITGEHLVKSIPHPRVPIVLTGAIAVAVQFLLNAWGAARVAAGIAGGTMSISPAVGFWCRRRLPRGALYSDFCEHESVSGGKS